MLNTNLFCKLITLLLVISTSSHRYLPLNDVQGIVSSSDSALIEIAAITISTSRYELVVFVGSSLDRIKVDNNLPSHFDTTNIDKFVDSLFVDIADKSNLILAVFAVEEGEFAFKLEEDIGLSDEALFGYYTRELDNFINKRYSQGIKNFCQSLLVKEDKVFLADLNILVWFLIVIAILMVVYIIYHGTRIRQLSQPTYTFKQPILLENKTAEEKRKFNEQMKKFKGLIASYEGKHFLDDYCIFCFDSFSQPQIVNDLPCRHRFHIHCIQPKITVSKKCPICQHEFNQSLKADFYQNIVNFHAGLYHNFSDKFYLTWTNGYYAILNRAQISNDAIVVDENGSVYEKKDELDNFRRDIGLIRSNYVPPIIPSYNPIQIPTYNLIQPVHNVDVPQYQQTFNQVPKITYTNNQPTGSAGGYTGTW